MALCQVAFMDQHISGRAALQSWRPDYAFTLVRANNISGAWSLVEFAASAIVCIYRCILTPTCFFLSIAMQVFSVFVEILPVREQEPTRERDKMFANGTFMFANGQRSRMGRNICDRDVGYDRNPRTIPVPHKICCIYPKKSSVATKLESRDHYIIKK